jgi:hypothetical protein
VPASDEQESSRGRRLTAGSAGRCISRAGRSGCQTRRPRADSRFPRRSIRAGAGATRWSRGAEQSSAMPRRICAAAQEQEGRQGQNGGPWLLDRNDLGGLVASRCGRADASRSFRFSSVGGWMDAGDAVGSSPLQSSHELGPSWCSSSGPASTSRLPHCRREGVDQRLRAARLTTLRCAGQGRRATSSLLRAASRRRRRSRGSRCCLGSMATSSGNQRQLVRSVRDPRKVRNRCRSHQRRDPV